MKTRSHWLRRAKGFSQLAARRVAFSLLAALCLVNFGLYAVEVHAAEVHVAPGFNTLPEAVKANPGSTFILERGGAYVIDQDIVINVPTIIKAGPGDEALAPPVIQYSADQGDAMGRKMFVAAANVTFEGVGIQGFTLQGELLGTALINAGAPDITIVVDGCVIQAARQFIAFNSGNNNSYILKNNIFFNHFREGWDSFGGNGTLWGGSPLSFQAYNNTYFMAGQVLNAGGGGPLGQEVMNHNTYVNTWGETFYPSGLQYFTATNNLFFNSQMKAYVGPRTDSNGDTVWEGDYRDWTLDSLAGDIAIFPHEYDSLDNDNPREVRISHNIKMNDPTVLDFYQENGISAMTLWNRHGREVFGPRYGWIYENNHLQEDGNEIDPSFAMGDLPDSTYTYAFLMRLERHLPADQQSPDFPYRIVWLPDGAAISEFIWPLPFDFKPTNKETYHLGSDGYPIGDLNWFGPDLVAAWENGDPNPLPTAIKALEREELKLKNYPNPSGGQSMFSYVLPEEGMLTLDIINVSGSIVARLVNEFKLRGRHEVHFDASDLSEGIYFCKIQMGEYSQVLKISVVR